MRGVDHWWVSIAEAARIAQLPRSTLYLWVAEARVTTRVAREGWLLVDLDEVDELRRLRVSNGRYVARPRRGA